MSLIEYKNVSVTRQEQMILKDVSVSVNEGDFVFLLGKVGSGKSTFLKSLYCEVPIDSGSATVLDYDLCKIKNRQIPYLRRQMGIVFQDFQLLPDRSVEANLMFVLKATEQCPKKDMQNRIEEVLKYVGLSTKGYRMPHELSGGEQQRVVIARALLNHPKILLADEPTGSLDPEHAAIVFDILLDLVRKSKMSMLFVTHDMNLAKRADRIITIKNGIVK